MIKHAILSVLLASFASAAFCEMLMVNNVPVEVGPVEADGSSCHENTVSVGVTDDNIQVTVRFEEYEAVTNDEMPVVTANCSIAVPLSVQPGYRVSILGMDWHGSVLTAPGAFVNFHREYFFSGTAGPVEDSNWSDSGYKHFHLEDDLAFNPQSDCNGGALIARADTSALVGGANSFFTLHETDDEGLLFEISITEC
jgi:Domain of unknown function (DUF4360)